MTEVFSNKNINKNNKLKRDMVTGISLCVLGSGSGGNCTVIAIHRYKRPKPYTILLDAGLSIKQTEQRLNIAGFKLTDIKEILVTHFDTDHFKEVWINRARRLRMKLRFHINHWGLANNCGAPEIEHFPFGDDGFEILPGCAVNTVQLAHDSNGTVGYRFDTPAGRLGFATDLGQVNKPLFDLFTKLDVLAIESNYCPKMQLESGRPTFLKRRIMGGKGHLSNEQSLEAVKKIYLQSPDLARILLLHLSRECNSPGRILSAYAQVPELSRKLIITNQDRATDWVHIYKNPYTQAVKTDEQSSLQMELWAAHNHNHQTQATAPHRS